MDEIFGYIERITYQNPENGYTVLQLQERGKAKLTTVVGDMPTVQPGESIRCSGEWKNHLVHGSQFEVKKYKIEAPADVIGIKKYLGSGLVKGIGPVYANRIVDVFGENTLNIIDTEPDRLLEVSGVGKKRINFIKECWNEQRTIRDVMIFLQQYGISPTYSQKIFKAYGNDSIKKLKENPYCLAKDILGIGFCSADRVAEKMGVAKDSAQRIDSGVEYILSELSSNGHVCYPIEEFLNEAELVLEVKLDLINQRIDGLVQDNRIVVFDLAHEGTLTKFIWIRPLFLAEVGIAREIRRLNSNVCSLRNIDCQKAIDWVQKRLEIELAENQKIAVVKSLSEKLQIITGGPGTGKSTITNSILEVTSALTDKIILAAPTGRAAKRMSEITGKKAVTIHSLLEYDFRKGGFKKNKSNPLDCDLLIVDEASMIDTLLMYNLLKAVPNSSRVIFVGDINQLPSVGPGNVLKDMISSNIISVTILNEIFRQAAGSRIILNSHKINQGIFPDIKNEKNSDFFFIECIEKEDVVNQIKSLVTHRLPKKYNFDAMEDIQVLSPMKKGILGTENLNNVLQEELNKNKNSIFRFGKKFQIGDKVMQIRNNYKKEVYNGDIGYITEIDQIEQLLFIDYEGKKIEYTFSELDEIVLAYTVSVHKSQGCQFPCVVVIVHTTHFKLLHRNLLYTAVTRAKKLVVLVGTKKALFITVNNDEIKKRYTGLQQAIVGHNNLAPV